MGDILTPQLVRNGTLAEHLRFGDAIDINDDAIDAAIELTNQIRDQMVNMTNTDKIAFIKTCIHGKFGNMCLLVFTSNYDDLYLAEYM
jgi:hypothetical protein